MAVRNQRVLPNGVICRVAGWGATQLANNVLQAIQQAANFPILDRTACNAAGVHAGRVQESMICAGSLAAAAPSACAVSSLSFIILLLFD